MYGFLVGGAQFCRTAIIGRIRGYYWSKYSDIVNIGVPAIAVKDYGVNTTKIIKTPRRRGRPQLFDRQDALNEAMKLFWERGYEGTSFSDLIAAMGISPSTFYNSFGSKEELFVEAVQHYMTGPGGERVTKILSGPDDTRTAFERLLEAAAFDFTSPNYPAGCMISLAGTHVPPDLQSVRDTMVKFRANFEQMMEDRLRRGVQTGDLAPDTDVTELASFFGTVFRGIAVQARDGKSRQHLLDLGRIAMRVWPRDANKRPMPKERRRKDG
jgi:AcrR family transcriptional regulator